MAKVKKDRIPTDNGAVGNGSLKSDEHYQKYRRILQNKAVDIEGVYQELTNLHAGRAVRNMDIPSPKKAAKASMQEVGYRSRLVELRVTTNREFTNLCVAHQAIKDHIAHHHAGLIEGRSIDDRQRSLRRLLPAGERRISELETLIEAIDLVISDIDQAGFALKRVVDSLAITNKGEHH